MEKVHEDYNNVYKEILSDLSLLTRFLPEINEENSKWLCLSAKYVDFNFRSTFFIEYLNNIKENGDSYKYISGIFEAMLEKYMPNNKAEKIQEIIEFLYNKEEKDKANVICNKYAKNEYFFLQKLYKKNNP